MDVINTPANDNDASRDVLRNRIMLDWWWTELRDISRERPTSDIARARRARRLSEARGHVGYLAATINSLRHARTQAAEGNAR